MSRKRNWTPHLTLVVLPGPSPKPLANLHLNFMLSLPPFFSSSILWWSTALLVLTVFWWDGRPPKLLPWLPLTMAHHSSTFTERSCTNLNSLTSSPHLTSHSPLLHPPTGPGTNLTLSSQGPVVPRHSLLHCSLCQTTTLSHSLPPWSPTPPSPFHLTRSPLATYWNPSLPPSLHHL